MVCSCLQPHYKGQSTFVDVIAMVTKPRIMTYLIFSLFTTMLYRIQITITFVINNFYFDNEFLIEKKKEKSNEIKFNSNQKFVFCSICSF